jgi:cell division cycle 2-like protein
VDRYRKLNRIDEGTYGVVYRARDMQTDEVVALKQLKVSAAKSEDGFPIPSLREVTLLTTLDHPNVIRLHEVVVGKSYLHIFMVMEYAEHELRALLQRHEFTVAERKCLLRQLLRGMEHLHARWVLHRDLKTSNILLTNRGVLKVCDFGLARHYGEPCRPYSKNVITLWYRPPELIIGQKRYTESVDMWSVGCVFGEMLLRKPLFEGKSELHQLTVIFELTGVPTEDSWPGYYELLAKKKQFNFKLSLPRWRIVFTDEEKLSDMGLELLRGLLTCWPERRLSAEAAGEDPYFWERPYALDPAMMPTFTDTNSTGRERHPALRPVSQQPNLLRRL